jgi:hypothetical protein
MRVAAGSWIPVFGVVVAKDIATALLALFALKQMRAAYLDARTSGPLAGAGGGGGSLTHEPPD